MGAKYLNEIDLGSREECLRLCCETEDCDVFVFEEKNSGSCYLFHCGPPEDFKCKFTHHVNYSSAVLSINRHLPDLESQIKLTKHVQELNKLRKPETVETTDILRFVPMVQEVAKPTPSTTLVPVITKEVLPIMEKQTEARKCSRYQFECRSTGECIAIYNACDGIPQCADGSDEAHELGCPAPEAVASAAAQTTTTLPKKLIQPAVHQVQTPMQQYGREGELVPQQVKLPPQKYQPVYHPQTPLNVQSETDFLRPVSDPHSPGRNQYEPAVVPVQNYLGMPNNNNNWGIPIRQNQQVQQMQQYPDSRMFTNKDNNIRPDVQISQLQYPEYPARVPNYYDGNYRQPIQQENWPVEEGVRILPQQSNYHPAENVVPAIQDKPEEKLHIAEAPQQQQQQQEPAISKQADSVVNPKHVQEKLAHDLKHSKDSMDHGPNQKVKAKVAAVSYRDEFSDSQASMMTDDTQDGVSHIPKGAILSLTLGLIITGVMAILIGCRLRVVRRRLRKGGKGYAHDADYLVNGMYL